MSPEGGEQTSSQGGAGTLGDPMSIVKSEACEAAHKVELTMNCALHQAQVHEKERCLEVLSQSHTHFNCPMEILGYEAFCLGWEQILTNPLARIFSSPEEYDALNKIESGNYDLDFYVTKEN